MQEIRASQFGVDPPGIWLDDSIDIFLDPGRTETYRYYQISFNSKGAYTKRRMKNDTSWEPKSLVIKTWRGTERWRAELRICFEDLGIRKGEFPKLWGANFYRTRWARRPAMDETPAWMNWDSAWRPNPIGTPHLPEMFGFLYFQLGDVIPPHLASFLKSRGLNLDQMGLKVKEPIPREEPVEVPVTRPAPAFANEPKIKTSRKGITIRFAVKAPTDVAVWVEERRGKVVRHIAGGLLGENPPEPLKPGLSQSLFWDYKDDDGKPVEPAGCKVVVALGLRAKFERIIGWRPPIGSVRSLAIGAKGELFVFTGGLSVDHGWADSKIRLFDHKGTYLRQLYPFQNNVPLERMKGIRPIPLPDHTCLPVIYNALNHSWFPESPAIVTQRAVTTPDGKYIIISNMCMRGMGHGRRLLKIGTDGSVPQDYLGPQITKYAISGELHIALSPDGKYIYATGLRGRSLWDPGEYHNVIYRLTWNEPRLREEFHKPFIGEFQTPGKDPRHFNHPTDIAVDPKGNIVVADSGNGRLAVFQSDGSPLKQIPLEGVRKVQVHPRTGALYVLTRKGSRSWELIKLRSIRKPDIVARTSFARAGGTPALVLNVSSEQPVPWLGTGDRYSDLGEKLELTGNLHKLDNHKDYADQPALFQGNLMYVDKKTEEIYVGKWHVFDGKTGKFLRRLRFPLRGSDLGWGGELCIGLDGNFYIAGANALFRFDPDGKPLPFAGGKNFVPNLYRGHGNSNRGHCVAPNGDIYFVHHYYSHGNTQVTVSQISPDGTVKRYEFIENKYTAGSGIRVDRKGYAYIGMAIKPYEEPYLQFFQGRLPTDTTYPQPWFFYRQNYGVVVKFKPEGGRVVKDTDGDYLATNYSYFHRCRIEGAEWVYYGFSPMHQKDIQSSRCNCESARFDLDDFGRLWIPDAMRASIVVIDNNANEIARIGGYGNMDARGPGSQGPKPEIALAWPLVVFATDRACYIADTINLRILKASLNYTVRKSLLIE